MKKAVVLLFTLSFIATISVLILKKLDDTNKYLEEQSYISNNTQLLISIKNTKTEVSKILVDYANDISDYFSKHKEGTSIPMSIDIEGLSVNFTLSNFYAVDINDLCEEDFSKVQILFNENAVYDFDVLKQIYLEKFQNTNDKIENNNQLEDLLTSFQQRSENSNIEKILDEISFLSGTTLYTLKIHASYLNAKADANYILTKNAEVKYFDISFN